MDRKIIYITSDVFRLTGENTIPDKLNYANICKYKTDSFGADSEIISTSYYMTQSAMTSNIPAVTEYYNYVTSGDELTQINIDVNWVMNDGTTGHTENVVYSGTNLNQIVKTDKTIAMAFVDKELNYIETKSKNYKNVGTIPFPGTSKVGVPREIQLVAWKNDSGDSIDVRVVNRKNGKVIAETTGVTVVEETLITLDNLNVANLKRKKCALIVQARIVGDSHGRARVGGILIEF